MSALAEKLRKARTLKVEVDGFVFYVLRPTPLEYSEKMLSNNSARGIMSLVIGWENVTELALFAGGSPHPLAFDAETCADWLGDYPDRFNKIAKAVLEGFEARMLEIGEAGKNSQPG